MNITTQPNRLADLKQSDPNGSGAPIYDQLQATSGESTLRKEAMRLGAVVLSVIAIPLGTGIAADKFGVDKWMNHTFGDKSAQVDHHSPKH